MASYSNTTYFSERPSVTWVVSPALCKTSLEAPVFGFAYSTAQKTTRLSARISNRPDQPDQWFGVAVKNANDGNLHSSDR